MKRCFSCFREYGEEFRVCPHCGQIEQTEAKEPIQLRPGTLLAGRYLLGEAIRSGGFGIIYKAWDSKLETIVAVKEFFPTNLATRALGIKDVIITKKSFQEYEYRKERFLAEARNMAKFGSHRNIPNVFEFFEENKTAYIVMELLSGMALDEYLHRHQGRVDLETALFITNEAGKALESLHEAGIIHRDVAPDNIYICMGEEIRGVKLIDLGAAKLADATDDVIDIVLKPGYSPVEQYDNSKNIGPWADVYALGATLYIMLTGKKPDESTNRKVEDLVVPPHEMNPDIPENLSNAVMKALAIDINMRFKNVTEFLRAINGEKKVLPLEQERKKRRSKRLASILASVAVVAAAAFFATTIYNRKRAEEYLKPADITVWYCAEEDSREKEAMEDLKAEFQKIFPYVQIELRDFSPEEYDTALIEAAATGNLPHLFESTAVAEDVLKASRDVSNVIKTDQFREALFLDQYEDYYSKSRKQIPLAIEAPIACVITNGAACVDYQLDYFRDVSDFGTDPISADAEHYKLIHNNFQLADYADREDFFEDASPVMLSSTLAINEVFERVQGYYENRIVYYDSDKIFCAFTYEWSLGKGTKDEELAAEKLLSWMLGDVYQNILMTGKNNERQIPVNPVCFENQITNQTELRPISEIYQKFVFSGAER